jgi:hypothetical protein
MASTAKKPDTTSLPVREAVQPTEKLIATKTTKNKARQYSRLLK